MSDNVVDLVNMGFNNWKEWYKLQLETVTVFANAMVKEAEANELNAQAAQDWERARIMHDLGHRLHVELYQLQQLEIQWRAKVATLQKNQHYIELIANGHNISRDQVGFMWRGFNVLERAMPSAVRKHWTTIDVPAEWMSGTNYVNIAAPKTLCEDVDSRVKNLLGLISWLHDRRTYMPDKLSEVYPAVCEAFEELKAAAVPERQSLDDEINAARDRVYKIWNPEVFVAAQPPAPRKISDTGEKS